jgi:hypothetical protein
MIPPRRSPVSQHSRDSETVEMQNHALACSFVTGLAPILSLNCDAPHQTLLNRNSLVEY